MDLLSYFRMPACESYIACKKSLDRMAREAFEAGLCDRTSISEGSEDE